MNPHLIETEDGEVLGVYVDGFVNKQLLVDTYNELSKELIGDNLTNLADFTVEDAKYMWCKSSTNEEGEEYLMFSDKEETGSFGVTAIYW